MAKRTRALHRNTAKIADVARLAGVSVATVSRTLARPEVVTEETRKRVLAAVRDTGYTPNISARNLRVRKTMVVLVAVPDIANPFFAEVLQGIDDTLSTAGYGLIIADLAGSPEKEARYVDLVCAGQADGVLLLCGHVMRSPDRDLREARVPLVAACEYIPAKASRRSRSTMSPLRVRRWHTSSSWATPTSRICPGPNPTSSRSSVSKATAKPCARRRLPRMQS